jgi:arabinofuranosyltransferase
VTQPASGPVAGRPDAGATEGSDADGTAAAGTTEATGSAAATTSASATLATPVPARWARALQALVLAAPSLVLLERAWSRRWMTDDGFINLRVARMILDGHGPVFNVGERVEATTSTLWVWLIAAGDVLLPLRMEWVAIVLGIVAAVGGLALATFGSARLHLSRGASGPLLPLGALVVAAVMPFWDFTTSGLEGGLTFGWLGLVGWLVCRWATGGARLGALAAAVVGLAPLVRPDLVLALPVVLGGVLLAQWPEDRARDRVRIVAAALAVPVAYQVFRMGYFGAVVPNTALAKASGRSRWGTGFAYLRDLVQPYWLWVPLVALVGVVGVVAAQAWRDSDRRFVVALTALPAVGVLDALYVVRVGGDYMHGRLLLPALFALVVPVAAIPMLGWRRATAPVVGESETSSALAPSSGLLGRWVRPRLGGSDRIAAGSVAAVVVVWAVVALVQLRPGPPVVGGLFSSDAHAGHIRIHGDHAVTADDQGWGPDSANVMLDPHVVVYVDGPLDVTPPGGDDRRLYASYGIGVGGYALGPDVYVIDRLGLADALISRFEVRGHGPTGHEKPIPGPWLAARVATGPVDPDQLRPPAFGGVLYESPPGQFDEDTEAARQALGCGDLRDLDAAVHEPMGVGRFLSNLVSATRLTRLEVPPDPVEAQDRFCS